MAEAWGCVCGRGGGGTCETGQNGDYHGFPEFSRHGAIKIRELPEQMTSCRILNLDSLQRARHYRDLSRKSDDSLAAEPCCH